MVQKRKTHSLITGGAGFIGSHLADLLLNRGHHVTVIDKLATGARNNIHHLIEESHFEFVEGSISDGDLVKELIGQADQIYHLAAAVGVKLVADDPVHTIETNIYPTERLLSELAKSQNKGKCMFLASSSEVYGKHPGQQWSEEDDMVFGPTSKARWAYGCSKAIDEFLALAYAEQYGVPVIVGRFFNVVGPRQVGHYGMVVPRVIEQALAGGPVVVYDDGQQIRCFAHVQDVVRAVTELMSTPAAQGEIFNIGSDTPVSIRSLAEEVVRRVGSDVVIKHIAYDKAYHRGFEDIRRRVPDLTKIRNMIGFECEYSLAQTIEQMIPSQ